MNSISRPCFLIVQALLLALPISILAAQPPALTVDQAFEKLKTYDEGQNNQALSFLEQQIGRVSNDPAQRVQMAERLAVLLADTQTSARAKLFICQQLRLVGGPAQVPLLAKMLADPKSADMARLVLQPMAGKEAGETLVQAVGTTQGDVLVGVINSLGARREPTAVPALAKLLTDPDVKVVGAAALALGKIGTLESADALEAATFPAALEPIGTEAQLMCAQTLGASARNSGDTTTLQVAPAGAAVKRATRIYLKFLSANYPLPVRMAALAGLAKAAPDQALAHLQASLRSTQPQMQGLAAELIRQLPEPQMAALRLEAARFEGLPKVRLQGALAERGERAAFDDLLRLAADNQQEFRAQALSELQRLRFSIRNAKWQEQLDAVVKDTGAGVPQVAAYGKEVIEQRRKELAGKLTAGDKLAGYLDCGAERRAQDASGLGLRQLNGSAYTFPDSAAAGPAPAGTVGYDTGRVEFEVAGLDPQKRYAVGFSWWDYDSGGRAQTITFIGATKRAQVLPSTKLPAFKTANQGPAIGRLPVDSSLYTDGKLRISVANQSGPNAVLSELWLIETQPGSATATQALLNGTAITTASVSVRPPVAIDMNPPAEGTKVLLVTGVDYPGHPWRQTAPALKKLLEEDSRLKVRIVEDQNAALASPRLKDWDVIIIHFMDWEIPGPGPEARENLKQVISSGKGLMLTHFACGAWDNNEWPEFKNLAGRVWDPKLRGHDPHGSFQVEIADPDHPITKGMKPFETIDELYTCLAGDAPIHVVAKAVSKVDKKDYAMAFVLDYGKGHVFHCVLGHDARAYTNNPGVGELMRRGCAWAAGLPPVK